MKPYGLFLGGKNVVNLATLEKEGYDPQFMNDTQPLGNIRFTESAIRTGTGYSTSLYTFKFNPDPNYLWMTPYTHIQDGIVTVDVATQDPEKIVAIIDKATREMKSRVQSEKDESAVEVAAEAYLELRALGKSVRKSKEVMKFIKLRLYIYADTLGELDKKVVVARKELAKNEFGVTSLLMEQKEEWQSQFLDYDSQTYLSNRRGGKDIPSTEFGASFPANFVSLHDRRGQYLGVSTTYGNIIFDPFELDGDYRNFYNILILGMTGAGKSTLMKKIMSVLIAKGYPIRGFDKSGEYTYMINKFKGKIIRLDGQDGTLNIFEIFASVMNEVTGEIDETSCFSQHLSKMAAWYSALKPTVESDELDELELLIHELYTRFGFIKDDEVQRVTGLESTDYPIMSDFIALVEEEEEKETNNQYRQKNLYKIHTTFKKLRKSYPTMMDGHTTFSNLSNEQVLFFNIDGLSSMKKEVVDAQLFNAITLFQGSLFKHGKQQKDLYEAGKISFDDIKRSMMFIDECHAVLNIRNPLMIEYITMMQREGRKAFVGTTLATQLLRALIPENKESEAAESLKGVFELCQYRFYFYFPPTSIDLLEQASAGELTQSQIRKIGKFKQGRCLLSIAGGENYEFKVDITAKQNNLFKGGGKNAA